VALVSGGFDSAVAAWQMQRRGVVLEHVFCNLGGAAHELGVLRVMKVVAERWSAGARPRLHAVDFAAVAAELRARTEARYWQVLLKRQMLRAAERVAREWRAAAIVTGEAVGQVSSQTLGNLAVISEATPLPILRPLVGANKDEIIALAGKIGTAELSAVVQEYCAMVPRRPATAAALGAILAEEARLDPEVLERAVAGRRVFDLHALDPDAHSVPELEVEAIPSGATVIDLRPRTAHRAWHWPGALQLDLGPALQAYPSFDKEKTYVLYCEFGLKSAHLAELMRRAGFEAFHVKGGTKQLMRAVAAELAAPVRGRP
jgi:thiamine biosynthesis protein ThiI